jgi:predicted nucleotidyltransferase
MRKTANSARRGVAERAKRWRAAARSIGLDRALAILRTHRERLSSMGVVHAGIFGSLARGEARKGSDIDTFVVLDESRHLSVYDFVGIQHFLQDVLHPRIDLVERDAVKPGIREQLFADAVNAF